MSMRSVNADGAGVTDSLCDICGRLKCHCWWVVFMDGSGVNEQCLRMAPSVTA